MHVCYKEGVDPHQACARWKTCSASRQMRLALAVVVTIGVMGQGYQGYQGQGYQGYQSQGPRHTW